MKFLTFAAVLTFFAVSEAADTCPETLQIKCVDDINKAYPICDQAAKEQGKDVVADLDCLKYFSTVDKDCWPCICVVAKANNWKIKGC